MTSAGRAQRDALPFATDGRRLIIYVIYDVRGDVEDYVLFALSALKVHAAKILVVANGELTDRGRARLGSLADRVVQRDNRGFDIGAQRDVLLDIGLTADGFDEVVLTNDTWFGPVHSFEPIFARMDPLEIDVWGLTEHPDGGGFPRHLQSFWIAVRRRVLDSDSWRTYWEQMPIFDTYWDAVTAHEVRFTGWAKDSGFSTAAAFPADRYPVDNASVYAADLLIADGCPAVKRRPFFHDPPFLARHAIIGRRLLAAMKEAGYPVELAMRNLARSVSPRVLQADVAALEVVPEGGVIDEGGVSPRVLAIVRTDDPSAAARFLERLRVLPPSARIRLAVSTADHAAEMSRLDAVHDAPHPIDICVVTYPGAGEVGAAIEAISDLEEMDFDLILAAEPAALSRVSSPAERYRSRYAEDNLLSDAAYFHRILSLFTVDPALGVVFPPLRLLATPDGFRDWGGGRAALEKMSAKLGIRVPLDRDSPLAPADGVWISRPEALHLMVQRSVIDAEPKSLRRLLVLAAAEHGYYPRTVLTRRHASIAHTSLEFASDVASSTTLGWPTDQLDFLDRADWHGETRLLPLLRVYLRMHRPRLHARLAAFRRQWVSR